EGSDGLGAGAVQQFFEVLGLTKPPRLEIDPLVLMCSGKPGTKFSTRVTIHTKDGKPVYAQAWTDQQWITICPNKYLGAKVVIPIEIVIPSHPGETLEALLTIRGNGQQHFVVPVTVA